MARLTTRLAVVLRRLRPALRLPALPASMRGRHGHELLDGIDAIVWEVEPAALRTTFVNGRFEELLGHPPAALLDDGRFWVERVVHPDERERVGRLLRSGAPFAVAHRALAADGETLWLQLTARPVCDGEGCAVAVRAVAHDVTEIKESEERLSRLWDAALEAVVVHVDGTVVEVNRAFSELFGYTAEEAVGMRIPALVTPVSMDTVSSYTAEDATEVVEVVGRTRGGEERYLEATSRVVPYGGRTARVTAMRDLTHRREAEARAGLLAYQYAADLTAVTDVARRLARETGGRSTRAAICEAVLDVCHGLFAVLMEPDEEGAALLSTGMAGSQSTPIRVDLARAGSATVDVFRSGRPHFVADLAAEAGLAQGLVEATGAAAALWEPVTRDGEVLGVLLVAWDRHVVQDSERAVAIVSLFAAEAAVAIERADLLERLAGLNRTLASQVEELRASDQLKSDFVSSVSHELRTPLASILGYLEALRDEEVGPLADEQREFLEIVDENARRLLALINDLLTLSGVEAGRMQVRVRAQDLAALVQARVAEQLPAVAERGLELDLELPTAPLLAEVDPERLGQVVTNVVANAIKFTPAGGTVAMAVDARDGEAVLEVRDTGIGIPEQDMPRLFERFFRARNAIDGAIPGTGLGLAICRGIVEAHGGTLAAESELGRGSTFTVRLPLAAEPSLRRAA